MKKTPSTIIGVKNVLTSIYREPLPPEIAHLGQHPVTLLLDAADNVWLFGQQVCPIIKYKHVYNTITRYCPSCRLLKPKEVKGFDIPLKVANRGSMIFPVADLPGLLAHSKDKAFKEEGLAWVQELVAQLTGTPATAQPPARVEPPPSDERWFKEVATYEFEGMVFTGLMDDEKIPGFIAKEVTDELGKQDQGGSTRYIPEEYKGWSERQTPGGLQKVRVIDERGFYQLIMNAQKNPKVRRFQAWVYKEVLPSIRETGEYRPKPQVEAPPMDLEALLGDNDKLIEVLLRKTQENKRLAVERAEAYVAVNNLKSQKTYLENRNRTTTHQLIEAHKKLRRLEDIETELAFLRQQDPILMSVAGQTLGIDNYIFPYCSEVLGWTYRKNPNSTKSPWLPYKHIRVKRWMVTSYAQWKDSKDRLRETPQGLITGDGMLELTRLLLLDKQNQERVEKAMRKVRDKYQQQNLFDLEEKRERKRDTP